MGHLERLGRGMGQLGEAVSFLRRQPRALLVVMAAGLGTLLVTLGMLALDPWSSQILQDISARPQEALAVAGGGALPHVGTLAGKARLVAASLLLKAILVPAAAIVAAMAEAWQRRSRHAWADGVDRLARRWRPLLGWILVAAAVHAGFRFWTIIRFVEGTTLVMVAGRAWQLATVFVVPAIVLSPAEGMTGQLRHAVSRLGTWWLVAFLWVVLFAVAHLALLVPAGLLAGGLATLGPGSTGIWAAVVVIATMLYPLLSAVEAAVWALLFLAPGDTSSATAEGPAAEPS